jgi:hypothetical protein
MTTNNTITSNSGTIIYTTAPSSSNIILANNTSYDYKTIFNSPVIVNDEINLNGDIIIKGTNLVSLLEKIEQRLAILSPDIEKLEKHQTLQKAYEQYKMLEALYQNNTKEK